MHRLLVLLTLLVAPALAQEPVPGPDLERINQLFFHQYDGDGNGLVSRREFLTPSMAQFEYLDRNADGVVDMREVSAFTRTMTEQAKAKAQKPAGQP